MNIPLPDPFKAISLLLDNVTFSRQNETVFSNFSWQIKPGEQWAIYGPVGSGKTTLLEALLGRLVLKSGKMTVSKQSSTEGVFREITRSELPGLTAYVSFQGSDNYFNYSRAFYQQRYQSLENELPVPTVQEVLQKSVPIGSTQNILPVADQLQLSSLLSLDVIKLSNGQTRKLQLARALLRQPAWLILDNPFTGLDTASRQQLTDIIDTLIEQGLPIMLATNQTELPEKITHVLSLNQFKVEGVYSRDEFYAQLNARAGVPQKVQSTALPVLPKNKSDFTVAVKLEAINVRYNGQPVLQDISWTVNQGEKWALTGPNGSGKSTLLSLIYADHPQAFANKITLFDRRKGSGESIWDLKKRMGFVSPELHLYFKSALTGTEIIATGFTDTLTKPRQITPVQQQLIDQHLAYFDRPDLAHKIFRQLSTGEQRLLLLIRSLIKNPDLIIWDEPFQGLNPEMIIRATVLLEQYCGAGATLILVSHHEQEIPAFVTKHLRLESGRLKSSSY